MHFQSNTAVFSQTVESPCYKQGERVELKIYNKDELNVLPVYKHTLYISCACTVKMFLQKHNNPLLRDNLGLQCYKLPSQSCYPPDIPAAVMSGSAGINAGLLPALNIS